MSNWKEMFFIINLFFNSVSFCDFLDPVYHVTLQFQSLKFILTFLQKANMFKNWPETIFTKTYLGCPSKPVTHVW